MGIFHHVGFHSALHPFRGEKPWSPHQFYVNRFYVVSSARIDIGGLIELRISGKKEKIVYRERGSVKMILATKVMEM